jgi:hypothetical protein
MKMMIHSDRLRARFRAKVQEGPDDECWPWIGARTKGGYGVMSGERRGDSPLRGHRVAYELHYGPIPDGLHVRHRCDNPPCCNPAHLVVGTNADNVADKVERGRQSRTALRGGSNPAANVNERVVAEIRRLLVERDDRTTRKIVRVRYGISTSALYLIRSGKTWRHVTPDGPDDDRAS